MNPILLAIFALGATVADAQTGSRNPADAANAFSLDLPAAAPAPATAGTPPSLPIANPDVPSTSVVTVSYTLDTPIAQLVLDPRAKAVLDRDLPGLSDDPNLPKFSSMSLHQFQPMTGGQLTGALLAETGADLAMLGGTPLATPPLVVAPTRDRQMDSGR